MNKLDFCRDLIRVDSVRAFIQRYLSTDIIRYSSVTLFDAISEDFDKIKYLLTYSTRQVYRVVTLQIVKNSNRVPKYGTNSFKPIVNIDLQGS